MFCVAALIAGAGLGIVRAGEKYHLLKKWSFAGELSAQFGQMRRRRGLIGRLIHVAESVL